MASWSPLPSALLPLLGFPVSITGIVLGAVSQQRGDWISIIGVILAGVGLAFTLVFAIIGAYVAATHQLSSQR
jgi:hypothetical protein